MLAVDLASYHLLHYLHCCLLYVRKVSFESVDVSEVVGISYGC